MKLRTSILSACFIASTLTTLGCGPRTTSEDASDVIELELWEISYPPEEVMAPIIRAFEALHPNVRVRMRQLSWNNAEQDVTMALAAGLPPDVCELGNTWVPRFAQEGVLLDLTDQTEAIRDDYIMWEPGIMDGRVHAFPWVVGTRILFVNRDLIERAGLNSESIPQTWGELEEAARRIDELGDNIHGIGLNAGDPFNPWQKFLPLAMGNGARVLNEDMSEALIEEDEMIETLELFQRLRPYALIDRAEEIDRAFGLGRVGMQISGPWMFRVLPTQYPELRYSVGLIPRPGDEEGENTSFLGGEMLVVFQSTEHPEEAYALAEFICRAENPEPICRNMRNVLPASLEGFDDPLFVDDPQISVFAEQIRRAQALPSHPRWPAIERVLSAMVEELLLYDDVVVDELAERHDRAVTLVLSE